MAILQRKVVDEWWSSLSYSFFNPGFNILSALKLFQLTTLMSEEISLILGCSKTIYALTIKAITISVNTSCPEALPNPWQLRWRISFYPFYFWVGHTVSALRVYPKDPELPNKTPAAWDGWYTRDRNYPFSQQLDSQDPFCMVDIRLDFPFDW